VVEIRAARAADEDELRRIYLATWSWLSSPLPVPPSHTTFFAPDRPPEQFLVAELDGRVAGFVRVAPSTPFESTRHVLMVRGISVDPAFQGRGVGRALVEGAIAEASRRGGRRLTLRVFEANERARRLYEAAGFLVEGVQRGEFFLNGQYVDDILMAYDLTT